MTMDYLIFLSTVIRLSETEENRNEEEEKARERRVLWKTERKRRRRSVRLDDYRRDISPCAGQTGRDQASSSSKWPLLWHSRQPRYLDLL